MSNNDQYQDWFAENYPNGTEPMFSFGRKVWNACCLQGARNRKNDLEAQNSTSNNTAMDEIALECQNYIDAAEGPYVLVSLDDLRDWVKQLSPFLIRYKK